MTVNTVVYSILSAAVIALMFTFVLPFMRQILPGWKLHWWANGITGVATVAMISPFLRAMIMKKNHSPEFHSLWAKSRLNRLPLIFTVLARIAVAAAFLFYICNYLSRFANALMITLALVAIILMIMSRRLKHQSIRMERMFIQNLRSRDIEAQVHGKKKPLFEGHLLDRDIHISEFEVPEGSSWAGMKLSQLRIGSRFGIHVSSILRGLQRINIPGGNTVLFPGDRIQAIGNDDQLRAFGDALKNELVAEDPEIEKREMHLRQFVIAADSPFIGKTLRNSGFRDVYNCMVVGVEEGQENLTLINSERLFEQGDIIWVVGEENDLERLMST